MATFMLIINIVIILIAIVLIVSVLMQQGNRAGLGAIGGGAETFFGKSKARSYEGKLEMITKISAAVFTVLVIILAATFNRYGSSLNTVTVPTPSETVAPAEEATAAPEDSAEATVAPEETAAAEAAVTAEPAAATEAPVETQAPAVTEAPASLATEAPAATPAA